MAHHVHHLGPDGVTPYTLTANAPARNGRIAVTLTAETRMNAGDIIDIGAVEIAGLPRIDLGTQVVPDYLFAGDTLTFTVSLDSPEPGPLPADYLDYEP